MGEPLRRCIMKFRIVAPLLFTIFLDMAAFGLLIPLVALYGKHYEASALSLALLSSTYSIFQFFFAPLWGLLSDRIGRRKVLLLTISGNVGGFLLFGFADSLQLLFVSRSINGIFSGNISVAQAYIADVTPEEKRAAGMGLTGAMIGLGFVAGPPLGGITAFKLGLHAPGYIAAGLAVINLIAAFIYLQEPESHVEARRQPGLAGLRKGFSANIANSTLAQLLLFLLFASTYAFCLMEHSFALYLQSVLQISTREAGYRTGLVLMWIGVLGVIIQGGLIRQLTKRFREESLLAAGVLVLVAAMLVFPFCTNDSSFYIAGTLIAIGGGLANPTLQSLISRNCDRENQGLMLGFAQGLSSLARILGPFSGISLFTYMGSLPFLVASGIYAALFVLVLMVLFRLLSNRTASISQVSVQAI